LAFYDTTPLVCEEGISELYTAAFDVQWSWVVSAYSPY